MDQSEKNTPTTTPQSIVTKETSAGFAGVIVDNSHSFVENNHTKNKSPEQTLVSFPYSKHKVRQKSKTTVTYCTHVGVEGTLVLIWYILVIAAYITALDYYTFQFSKLQRDWIWLFILVPSIYATSFILSIRSWKAVAVMYTNQAKTVMKKNTRNSNVYTKLHQIYRKWSINGEYFLWKLFFTEFVESINQLVNMFQIYLCSFEPIVICIVSIVFCGDSLFRAYYISQTNTPKRRKRQHVCDGIMDSLCMIVPIVIIVYKYHAPILINEMILLVAVPSIMLMLKIRTFFREVIRARSNTMVLNNQASVALTVGRNRESLYGSNMVLKMAHKQQEVIPKQFRNAFLVYNVGYGLFMLFIGVMSLISINVSEKVCGNEPLWEIHCKVQVPVCTSLFTPTCNCVVLNVPEHNMTTLPNVFLDMSALKHVTINHGPLQTLPKGTNKFRKLRLLDLSYNHIESIADSLENLPLNYLTLNYNRMKEIPNVIFTLEKLVWLLLIGNNITSINPLVYELTNLFILILTNNSIQELPPELFKLDLVSLYVDGNNITEISTDVYKWKNMLTMRLDNNPLFKVIPNEFGEMPKLQSLDLRYNSIENLPITFKKASNLKYLYLDGNEICKSDAWQSNKPPNINVKISGCTKQCSKFCQDVFPANELRKGTCWNECSMQACVMCESCDTCQCGCNM